MCIVEPSKVYWNSVGTFLYTIKNLNNTEVKDILGHSYNVRTYYDNCSDV